MPNKIFINLPVTQLHKATDFYRAIGFVLNPQFSNEDASALALDEHIFVMLLTHPFFQSFIPSKTIAPSTSAEVINGLHLTSKEEVDMLLDKALTAGAHESRERYDYGFMYGRTFEDLDGHIWEVFRMDPSQMPQD